MVPHTIGSLTPYWCILAVAIATSDAAMPVFVPVPALDFGTRTEPRFFGLVDFLVLVLCDDGVFIGATLSSSALVGFGFGWGMTFVGSVLVPGCRI